MSIATASIPLEVGGSRGGEAPRIDIDVLNNPKLIQEYVGEYEKKNKKPMPETTRRNIYSLLSRLFPNASEYRINFLDAVGEIKSKDTQTKSNREEENWLSMHEIQAIYEAEWDKHRPILKSEMPVSPAVLAELSNFILLAVTSGVFIPPRRTTDWTEMKIRNYSPTENYYKAGKFHFNIYKTAGVYGEQVIEVPRKLRDILKMYIEKNPHDYLLLNNFGGKLFESGIPPRLNKIFNGKKISTTMLRHIYLSEFHKDTPDLEDMRKTAHDMGHSYTMGLEYVRR
jgi:integrase